MNKKKQTKINFYSNIIALLANVLVGIYYTPYLVNSLGLAAYGVLPLALIINQYIGVATHEQYYYEDYLAYQPDTPEKIYLMSKLLHDAGYRFVTADELN